MTIKELEKLLSDMVEKQLKGMGQTITDKVKEEINDHIEKTLKEKVPGSALVPDEDELLKQKNKDPKFGFKDFSEFAMAVVKAEPKAGGHVDDRLKTMQDVIKKAAGTSLTGGDSEYGGYLIPEGFRTQLFEIVVEKSNILQKAIIVPMQNTSVSIPFINDMDHSGGTVHGGVQFYWLDSAGQKTESRPKFGKVQMRLNKLAGLCYVDDELLTDSPISMEPLLTRMFTDALAWTLDNVFINGNGAGQPMGILNAPCLISQTAETGQAAATILYENIIKMYSRQYNKSGSQWWANDEILAQLLTMSLTVGTGGGPVYMPPGGASVAPYDTLLGKAINWTEHCQSLGTVGDIFFCDWTQYLIGQKAGMAGPKFDSSIHLKFDYDQTAFRFVFRVDGQPWWPSALTPRYATSHTKSPFIALATRS